MSKSLLDKGDILLLVPPFARTSKAPILDPHILQTLALQKGYKADIVYLNILLASLIGTEMYDNIANAPRFWMIGERLFARSAYGLPPLGKDGRFCSDERFAINGQHPPNFKDSVECDGFDVELYLQLEACCYAFVEAVVSAFMSFHYNMLWSTIGWEQTNCTIAIFNKMKAIRPEMMTLTGGMNCEGEMAEGVASLSHAINYVFSGEIELTFQAFLDAYTKGEFPAQRILYGTPMQDLDSLSLPDYGAFFIQQEAFLGEHASKTCYITYETSRGCWRGQKHQCAFCSLNSQERLQYRYKKSEKVLEELAQIAHLYPGSTILMNDHIMPISYFQNVLPHLVQLEKKELSIRYEIQPELDFNMLSHLKYAGIRHIQPGIEALSTTLLTIINKRTTARQNVFLLRNALSLEIYVYWYLLWGFPGDKAADYEDMLQLFPLLRHLQPPALLAHARIERFSSYVQTPQRYHISNLRPWAVYKMIYPDGADIEKLAYRFAGEYPSESHEHPELIQELTRAIASWKKNWRQASLVMYPVADYYMLYDSRGIAGKKQYHMLNFRQARQIMSYGVYNESDECKWAVDQKLGVVLDSWYVPLITASPELMVEFGKSE